MGLSSDRKLLGVEKGASRAELKLAYHRLAAKSHPDHGGDVLKFQNLNEAYRRLLYQAKQPKRCPECSGKGRVVTGRVGFQVIWATCPRCKGKGKCGGD